MKVNKTLKVMVIILIIMIIIMISFVGIFIKDKNRWVNIMPNYKMGKNLGMQEELVLAPSTEILTNYYDKDGKLVDSSTVTDENKSDYTEKEEPANPADVLNLENYKQVLEIMTKRLDALKLSEYTISLDESTGNIIIRTLEKQGIGSIISGVYKKGEFLIKDAQTGDILLNNADIKKAEMKSVEQSSGIVVYVSIEFNKDGAKKLEQVTRDYIKTEKLDESGQIVVDEEGNPVTETKSIEIYIDGTLVDETYFDSTITDGRLPVVIGQQITTQNEFQYYLFYGDIEANKLSSGNFLITYEVEQNVLYSSDVLENMLPIAIIVAVVVLTLMLLYLIIRYKERGIISSVLLVGFVALLMLAVRYGNIYISIESIMVILFMTAFYFIFLCQILNKFKKLDLNATTPKAMINKTILNWMFILIPLVIILIVFILFNEMGISSFGTVLFWGVALFVIYTYMFTKTLLLNFEYLFEE